MVCFFFFLIHQLAVIWGVSNLELFYYCVCLPCMCVCVCTPAPTAAWMHAHTSWHACRGTRTACRGQFFSSLMRVPEVKHRFLGLATSTQAPFGAEPSYWFQFATLMSLYWCEFSHPNLCIYLGQFIRSAVIGHSTFVYLLVLTDCILGWSYNIIVLLTQEYFSLFTLLPNNLLSVPRLYLFKWVCKIAGDFNFPFPNGKTSCCILFVYILDVCNFWNLSS